jgi:hypothetical protein
MKKERLRKSISIKGVTYFDLKLRSQRWERPISQIVEQLIADTLDASLAEQLAMVYRVRASMASR